MAKTTMQKIEDLYYEMEMMQDNLDDLTAELDEAEKNYNSLEKDDKNRLRLIKIQADIESDMIKTKAEIEKISKKIEKLQKNLLTNHH